ncbi:MAG: hypothetical protein MUQ30_10455, partial [Anaerolineae bacterium]|nr:hypothetical protein [Anaerolineae bacterium]
GRLEDGWIGLDKFPVYELAVRQADSEVEDELWTNYESEGKDIVVRVRDSEFIPGLEVLDATGKRIELSTEPIAIELKEGDNWLGFAIRGVIQSGDKAWFRWVGFDWIKVIYEAPEKPTLIEAPETPGETTFDLCELHGAKWEITVSDYDECASAHDTRSDGVITTHVRRFAVESERPCDQMRESANSTIIKPLDWSDCDCAYIVAYTDPATGKVLEGEKAHWAVKFVVDDLAVSIDPGAGAAYPDRSIWVTGRVTQFELGYRRLAAVDFETGPIR